MKKLDLKYAVDQEAETKYRAVMETVGRMVGLDVRDAPLSFVLAFTAQFFEVQDQLPRLKDRNARHQQLTGALAAWLLLQTTTEAMPVMNAN